VNMGGTVDPKYHMPALSVVDHNTFKRIGVKQWSSKKLEYDISVPESTLRLVLTLWIKSSVKLSKSVVLILKYHYAKYH